MREIFSQLFQITFIACVAALILPSALLEAKQDDSGDKKTVEPVFRVPRIKGNEQTPPPERTSDNRSLPNYQPAPLKRIPPNPTPSKDMAQQLFANSNTSVVGNRASGVTNPFTPVSSVVKPPITPVAKSTELAPAPDKQSLPITPEIDLSDKEVGHPLDRAIELARTGLSHMRENISDYTAIMVKRERVDNTLSEPHYMRIKIRNPRNSAKQNVPFSIYMKFLKPRGTAGREVIWVDGQNSNNLIAHETGALLRFRNFHLQPDGMLAMRGNRYPIYDAGMENLALKLIQKAERDRAAGNCEVNYHEGFKVNKRPCTIIEVIHHEQKEPYEFHIAKVYIDDELQIPIRFVSYDWPVQGGSPRLMEEYTYINVKLNVGLTDNDFSITNSSYGFAK